MTDCLGAHAEPAGAPSLLSQRPIPEIDSEHIAWCRVDHRVIFLDIEQDRYFCLPDTRNADLIARIDCGAVPEWSQPQSLPRHFTLDEPLRSSEAIQSGPFRLREVARAIWVQRRVEAKLASTSLAAVIHGLQSLVSVRADLQRHLNDEGRGCIRAFEHARVLRSAADRCLTRSIALAICLAGRGCRTQLVIGVKAAPFGAHCWVQSYEEVLNDSAEEVRRYHPILVI